MSGSGRSIDGHVIVVVGGTRGIGAGIAGGLAADGARIVLAGRDVEGGTDVEWRSRPIAVNELIPGPVRTAMTGFDPASENAASPENAAPNPMEAFAEASREWLKDPDDVIPLARLLAGFPANGPSGQVFSLAGRV